MRKTRYPTACPLRTWSLLLCALLGSACQPESAGPGAPLADHIDAADNTADLSGDALTAPEQPQLRISAQAATLILDWSPIAGQKFARLYRYDAALSGETLVFESDDSQLQSLHLPSDTVQTPWHRQMYRLELCTADNCVSSARMALSGLAPATSQHLSPAVFLQGERYAEHLAMNHDASLAVIAMPLEGALEFRGRSGAEWPVLLHLRLASLTPSTDRTMQLSSSSSGDTIAVLTSTTEPRDPLDLRILERLGETWVQIAAWTLPATQGSDDATAEHSLLLSSSGDDLLLQTAELLYTVQRSATGWSAPAILADIRNNSASTSPDSRLRLSGSTANGDFTRILALVQQQGSNALHIWSTDNDAGIWQPQDPLPLNGFSPSHELALRSNAKGDELLIAGWEASDSADRYPIMWRYAINRHPDAANPAAEITLQALDSLRAPPASAAQASLVFSASESLNLAVLGWQLADDPVDGVMADASVSTWQYQAEAGQWLSALELPEAIPTLAKQAFGNGMSLSADGGTLMISGIKRTQPDGLSISEVLVLQ